MASSNYLSTKGGIKAHLARRAIHISIISIPFLYYFVLMPLWPLINLHIVIIFLLLIVILFEMFRVWLGLLLFGQRAHEASHFSAFGWTILSLGLILLFSPLRAFSFAIISSCALVDPLLGELRARKLQQWKVIFTGMLVVLIVWLVVSYFDNLSYVWAVVMAPLVVALEWPSLKWIDDNALMMLVPLMMVIWV